MLRGGVSVGTERGFWSIRVPIKYLAQLMSMAVSLRLDPKLKNYSGISQRICKVILSSKSPRSRNS